MQCLNGIAKPKPKFMLKYSVHLLEKNYNCFKEYYESQKYLNKLVIEKCNCITSK